jgi:hypothetical protein
MGFDMTNPEIGSFQGYACLEVENETGILALAGRGHFYVGLAVFL